SIASSYSSDRLKPQWVAYDPRCSTVNWFILFFWAVAQPVNGQADRWADARGADSYNPNMDLVVLVLGSYLLGAIPFGYLVARSRGVDLLSQGSKNIGATNVGRVMGLWWGVLVFVLDFAKGAVPVLLAGWLVADRGDSARVLAGLTAFLGHLFPIYLRFRGGKGVATGAGIMFVLVPLLTLISAGLWAVVLLATRYMSLASLSAAVLFVVLRLTLVPEPFGEGQRIVTTLCLVAAAAVWIRHLGNIQRLIAGTENRLGSKS
ncbi:MAG: glycerol-3-phosphate 1-O-acyltransferase PlsY, partial [Gemmataceae bacterium]